MYESGFIFGFFSFSPHKVEVKVQIRDFNIRYKIKMTIFILQHNVATVSTGMVKLDKILFFVSY